MEKSNISSTLGAFSLSLNVKNIQESLEFYQKLGFVQTGGDLAKNYVILKNGNSLIGLFQGMFQGNMMTFNPGWDESGKEIESFKDVREIQKDAKANNIILDREANEETQGPEYIMLKDPDGNAILIDQHR